MAAQMIWQLFFLRLPLMTRAARIGIVTMHSPEIMSYANTTSLVNQEYAERHGYGFHILNHTVDTTRVPHWSKIHALLIHLADYDFAFWIDADAMFYDHSRRIEDVLQVQDPTVELWSQDIWPDYPTLHRKEKMDGATFLIRNSEWARRFLLEMYFYPPCIQFLNWTEQYCLTLAYNANLLNVREKTLILPTPTLNHHRIPALGLQRQLFIWHLAGRSTKQRASHMKLVYEDYGSKFQEIKYQSFWNFYKLFEDDNFGDLASLQLCVFGLGERHQSMIEAMLFHFPYHTGFVVTRSGSPGLWTQMRQSEAIGDKFGSRMASLDLWEYRAGRTREGEDMVTGFFCDLMVLGVESWRHLSEGALTLPSFARAGLEGYQGPRGQGFGYSGLKDVYMVILHDSCEGTPSNLKLDSDDENGRAMEAACHLVSDFEILVDEVYAGAQDEDAPERNAIFVLDKPGGDEKVPWDSVSPERWGSKRLGQVTLARLPRYAFPKTQWAQT
ncbi:unnamed protein product [Durusdinium trenchii]|uniref:Uncharacterized protein n=2 Tax=Durusdinium trenchii TaxID=1381693 RepID=A0ABP0IKX3_9DINO